MYASFETIPIVLIKEYYWCPLYAYMALTTWSARPTPSMEEGGLSGWSREALLNTLSKHEKLDEAQLYWELPVYSKRLNISGRVDLVLEYDSEAVIVEAKLAVTKTMLRRRGVHIIAQLAAYTIAAEETLGKPVARTYIYSVESNELIRVKIGPQHRTLVEEAVKTLKDIASGRIDPRTLPKPPRIKCSVCSYRSICPLR